ncbi:MAG: hypothetical protein LC708_03395, partial [Actinobacteria bacterium]|nr:hypothetical protein [Actinomycetota bacterium]
MYNSQRFTTSQAGTYRWTVRYSGDANNTATGPTPCSDPGAATSVDRKRVVLATTASPAGVTIHDTATITGGLSPTGTITFILTGPNDTFCSGPATFTTTVNVTHGNGSYDSLGFTPTLSGEYRWRASYGGDANNLGATITPCIDPAESVTVVVGPPPVTLTTTASPGVVLGGAVSDTATLTGGTSLTGTITFRLFAPTDPTCSGVPVSTSTKVVAGTGTYPSDLFTATAPGTYRWVASYSGDANNPAAGPTACADPAESVTVTAPPPVNLTTTASPGVAVGGAVHDTATLGGGLSPTGVITFRLYGPNDAACTGAPVFTAPAVPVVGAASYDSANFAPIAPGTYHWVASYSGDANNAAVGPTACADPAESVTVTAPPPVSLTTTASPGVAVGGAVHDTANLGGGLSPTGSITFRLYGPNDAACTGA